MTAPKGNQFQQLATKALAELCESIGAAPPDCEWENLDGEPYIVCWLEPCVQVWIYQDQIDYEIDEIGSSHQFEGSYEKDAEIVIPEAIDSIREDLAGLQELLHSSDHPGLQGSPLAWVLAILMLLFAGFMWFLGFEEPDYKWTWQAVTVLTGITMMAVGLTVYAVFPVRGWWGMRLVTFSIFAGYLGYLIAEFFFSDKPFDPAVRQSAVSPYNALLGFLVFGVPAMLYTFSGHEGQDDDSTSAFLLAWSRRFFISLSVFSTLVILWRAFVG